MSARAVIRPSKEERAAWLAPGRRTLVGYLHVVRGRYKRDYGLLGNIVAEAMEESGMAVPRHPDMHAVWFGFDPEADKHHDLIRPFVRYKASRPIDGLDSGCNMHRVEVTCTIGKAWDNGVGAYITRASGRCLECAASGAVTTTTEAE